MTTNAPSTTPAVVVTASGVPSTVACLRSLGSRGVHTIAVAEHESIAGFHSAYCDEAVVVPDPEAELLGYRDALADLAARPDVRTVIPTREADVYLLARYRERFEPHVSIPVPSFDSLRTVHDRIELARAGAAAGVPVPETRRLSAVEEWSNPVVVKSRYNLLAEGYLDGLDPDETVEVDRKEHLRPGDAVDRDDLRTSMGHDPIVQEYVPGEEYMVGALYDHGEALALVQHHQVRGMSYTGAGGVYRESVANLSLESAARTLLDHLDWHGLACLEYIRDERTGEFKLAEINPRMWQSLAANVNMGADFPLYYWLLATGNADRIDPPYDVGVGSHWVKGEFLHFLSLLRDDSVLVDRPGTVETVRDIVTSTLRNPSFDLLGRDDLAPFVQDWWALFCAIPGVPDLALPGTDATSWDGPTRIQPARDGEELRVVAEDD